LFIHKRLIAYALIGVGAGILFFPVAFAGHVLTALLAYRLVVRFRTVLYSHSRS